MLNFLLPIFLPFSTPTTAVDLLGPFPAVRELHIYDQIAQHKYVGQSAELEQKSGGKEARTISANAKSIRCGKAECQLSISALPDLNWCFGKIRLVASLAPGLGKQLDKIAQNSRLDQLEHFLNEWSSLLCSPQEQNFIRLYLSRHQNSLQAAKAVYANLSFMDADLLHLWRNLGDSASEQHFYAARFSTLLPLQDQSRIDDTFAELMHFLTNSVTEPALVKFFGQLTPEDQQKLKRCFALSDVDAALLLAAAKFRSAQFSVEERDRIHTFLTRSIGSVAKLSEN